MKVIIFRTGKTQIYLHINKIYRTYTHKYAHYTKTTFHLKNHLKIVISDFQNGDFNQLIHDFIKSDENLKIIEVKDLIYESKKILFTLVDWVSKAMGK